MIERGSPGQRWQILARGESGDVVDTVEAGADAGGDVAESSVVVDASPGETDCAGRCVLSCSQRSPR